MSHPQYKHIGSPEDRIMEECGEILQALGKGKRFGWDNYHPDTPDVSNLLHLSMKINDLFEAFQDLIKKHNKSLKPTGKPPAA